MNLPMDDELAEGLAEPYVGDPSDRVAGRRCDRCVTSSAALVTAGVAGLVGGAISMGLREYVSVSSHGDSQRALIAKERVEHSEQPEAELDELTGLDRTGLTPAGRHSQPVRHVSSGSSSFVLHEQDEG